MAFQRPANRPLHLAEVIVERRPRSQMTPLFVPRPKGRTRSIGLPDDFVDCCRKAFHSLSFDDDGPRVLGITSAVLGDGKTSVAVGMTLAAAADTGEPTLLVECDLEQPAFSRIFGIEQAPGLADWVDGAEPMRCVRMAPLDNAYVMTAGSPGSDPARIFYQMARLNYLDELRRDFRNIIIDLPPTLSTAYSQLACQLSDHILLVARHGVTSIRDLQAVTRIVGPERLDGVVLNAYASRIPAWVRRLF
jgi:Mrp family chromosome partitioning ATPase